jgi:FkbM family methyltransferase
MNWLKVEMRHGAHLLGYDIHRYRDDLSALRAFDFATIVDVGANVGQFFEKARRAAPEAAIHCFEPMPFCFQQLTRAIARDRKAYAYSLALGDSSGKLTLLASEFTAASSLLPKALTHTAAFPYASSSHHPVTVEVTTLDAWCQSAELAEPILLKLDVEGYEDRVLRGATRLLRRTTAIWLEVSFVELYQGQPLFADIHNLLQEKGFQCAGFAGGGYDPRTGLMLYTDALFVRVGTHPSVTTCPSLTDSANSCVDGATTWPGVTRFLFLSAPCPGVRPPKQFRFAQ